MKSDRLHSVVAANGEADHVRASVAFALQDSLNAAVGVLSSAFVTNEARRSSMHARIHANCIVAGTVCFRLPEQSW